MRIRLNHSRGRWGPETIGALDNPAPQGRIAVVSYVPDQLSLVLGQLMESVPLPGSPNAHLTLLPPRPLLVHIEEAFEQARGTLRRLSEFSVELSDVCRFPETNVLYIEIGRGNEQVRRAHDALNVAKLAYREEYEFIPHVTLTQPVSQDKVEPLQQRIRTHWSRLDGSRSFMVDHAVFLWHSPGAPNNEAWQRLWSEPLPRAASA